MISTFIVENEFIKNGWGNKNSTMKKIIQMEVFISIHLL